MEDEIKTEKLNHEDLEMIRLLGPLTPAKRVRNMLEAQKFALSIIRGRVRRQFPHLTQREINIKIFDEIYKIEKME